MRFPALFALMLLATPSISLAQTSDTPVTAPVDMPAAVTAATAATAETPKAVMSEEFQDFGSLDLAALLDAQVETASKKSESISKAPAFIEIMTRKQLLDLGVRDLYTALSYLPGIEFVETYAGTPTLVFRGQMMEQYNIKVLMLINGHPSYESVNSLFNLELVPIEAIERIEVIRGPGSVLYGTNAYAGVINIITRTRSSDGVDTLVRGEAGQFTTFAGGAGNVGQQGPLNWGVFAHGSNSRGFPYRIRKEQNTSCVATPPSTADECTRPGPYAKTLEYYNNYASGYGDVSAYGIRLQAGGLQEKRQKFGIFPEVAANGQDELQHVFGDLSYSHDWESFSLLARAGVDFDSRVTSAGLASPAATEEAVIESSSQMSRMEINTGWSVLEVLRIDQGVSAERSAPKSFDFRLKDGPSVPIFVRFDEKPEQTTLSWYGQGTWKIVPELTMVAGIRVSRFQTGQRKALPPDSVGIVNYIVEQGEPIVNQSPRGGLVYSPREDTAIKLLYGEAFRVPNLWETNVVVRRLVGTKQNLKPETIRTFEFGVDNRTIEWMSLRANAYYSKLDNLIGRRPALDTTEGVDTPNFYDNTQRATTLGAELGINAVASEAWTFFANLSWKRTEFELLDPRFKLAAFVLREVKAAPFTSNAGTSYQFTRWLIVRPNVQYVGARGYAESYVLANAVVDFPVTERVTLSAIGNNLLDDPYTYPEYVLRRTKTIPGGPGRALYGRVTANF